MADQKHFFSIYKIDAMCKTYNHLVGTIKLPAMIASIHLWPSTRACIMVLEPEYSETCL